jgi:hypothetical protein
LALDVTAFSLVREDVDMPLPMALARPTVRFQVNHAEMKFLEAKAHEDGKSLANYVRDRLGLPERSQGRPTVDQLEAEQDQAWQILQDIGLDPAQYFPPDDAWLDDYR